MQHRGRADLLGRIRDFSSDLSGSKCPERIRGATRRRQVGEAPESKGEAEAEMICAGRLDFMQ